MPARESGSGARERRAHDGFRAVLEQDARALGESRAGCDDVVDEQYVLSFDELGVLYPVDAADVGAPRFLILQCLTAPGYESS